MKSLMKINPEIVFKTRIRDESIKGENPYRWHDVTTKDLFANRKVLVFSLPGAFTPTCDTYQLPTFELLHDEFVKLGIEDIYCASVNDAFVMNKWAESQDISKVKMLPDGNARLTSDMNMLCSKVDCGFGERSWRYAMIVEDLNVTQMWVEENSEGVQHPEDNCPEDNYVHTNPDNILAYLRGEESTGRMNTRATA